MRAAKAAPVSVAEAKSLFADLVETERLVLAVSGGADSTALLWLAARWRAACKSGPDLLAVTIDHGLRTESAKEARAVKKLAKQLGVTHRTLPWEGPKPKSGLQEAARLARYRLLGVAAREHKAVHVLTAHTRDDQAETVLLRLARGSGMSGLAAMTRMAPLPSDSSEDLFLVRPFLDVPKERLVATLKKAGVDFSEDPSNRDPRFTRVRLREVMPALEPEGLSIARLSLLARRLRRADSAIEAMVRAAALQLSVRDAGRRAISFDAAGFARLPGEVALRLLGRAIAETGNEGPVELAKLEALLAAFVSRSSGRRVRRTLAGAMVTLEPDTITVERAPLRRNRAGR